ncbi:MAG: rhodanese-like domain-containing protein [Verrucomicrobiales bacterium]
MKVHFIALFAGLILISSLLTADEPPPENPQIDFPAFIDLAGEVHTYREDRRVTVEEFLEMAQDGNTLILDTRSKANYEIKHIKGAVHLNFSEMTTRDLKEAIPSKDTRILIYCNNNFLNNIQPLTLKSAPLALNIPTFITLYGYGYKNLYELGPAIDENEGLIEFESNLELPLAQN